MTQEHYAVFRSGLLATLEAHSLQPAAVKNIGHCWDLFHKAWMESRFNGHDLYKHYNDAQLETAMRKIFGVSK